MDRDVMIRAEGLGKRYLIGHRAQRDGYRTLRDDFVRSTHRFLRTAADMARGRQILAGDEIEEFWALRNVDFEVRRGDVVGIVGRNGAGKSTLLKVLSRITEPSEGRASIRGRVASLLEVGTGFHPELSGRENIFLNGAILGMSRAHMRRLFGQIVDFADVEKFIDTPVKRYSSGMYVRLAFSIAAHLEPDVLIVDEVLAVGDADFQKKCLGRMQSAASDGRTVLFVSHNANSIRRFCNRGMLLDSGEVLADGGVENVLEAYLGGDSDEAIAAGERELHPGFRLHRAYFVDGNGARVKRSSACSPLELVFEVSARSGFGGARPTVKFIRSGSEVAFATTGERDGCVFDDAVSRREFRLKVPSNVLNAGHYHACLRLTIPSHKTIFDDAPLARVLIDNAPATGSLRNEGDRWPGVVAPLVKWSCASRQTE